MKYACIATTNQLDARCRSMVNVSGGRCSGHTHAKQAPPPDLLLLKFTISSNHTSRLVAVGVPYIGRDRARADQRHAEQAKAIGRSAMKYKRGVADSGTPVFDKEGLQNVGVIPVLEELPGCGYKVGNFQIEPGRKADSDVIVIAFRKDVETEVALNPALGEFIGSSAWGRAHVWANPRNDAGQIPHTVNLLDRKDDADPQVELTFSEGLWGTQPFLSE